MRLCQGVTDDSLREKATPVFQPQPWNLPAGDHGCSLSFVAHSLTIWLVDRRGGGSEKVTLEISSNFELVLEPHDGRAETVGFENIWRKTEGAQASGARKPWFILPSLPSNLWKPQFPHL